MTSKTFIARPINHISNFDAQVDIIIPFHGQYERVSALLDSLFKLTRSNHYRIYLVDDCSPNSQFLTTIQLNSSKHAERLRRENVVVGIRNEEQKGFAGACKVGFDAGESSYVCFLNSDCLIKDTGWLRNMGETLLNLKPQGVRMVSAMTNNPMDGDSAQLGQPFVPNGEDVILSDDSYLSMYCFLCHRQLFDHVGGFLKEYPYGGFEDQEFAARMRKHGFKQAVSRNSWVHHEGGATFKSLLRANPNLQDVIEKDNRSQCIADMKQLN